MATSCSDVVSALTETMCKGCPNLEKGCQDHEDGLDALIECLQSGRITITR